MKYWSEKTNEKYDTLRELDEAEAKFDKAKADAEAKAREKDRRWEEVEKARENYKNLYDAYMKDYYEDRLSIFDLLFDF